MIQPIHSRIQPPEQEGMGRTTVVCTVTNAFDRTAVEHGLKPQSDVRSETFEAIVETGATYLSLPASMVQRLGLVKNSERSVRTTNGIVTRSVYSSVWLDVQDRADETPVLESSDDVPPLLGVFPLEQLDFIVSPKEQRLEGNPEHGGEFMLEQY